MSGYFHARDASSVSKKTGIVYKAGKVYLFKPLTILENHASFARSALSKAPPIMD